MQENGVRSTLGFFGLEMPRIFRNHHGSWCGTFTPLEFTEKKKPQVVFVQEKRRRGDEIIGPNTKKVLLDLYADFFSGLAFRETKVL